MMHMTRQTVIERVMASRNNPYVSGPRLSVEPMVTVIISMAIPMLTTIPDCLMKETIPDASLVCSLGTEDIMIVVFGEENIANPNPPMIIETIGM